MAETFKPSNVERSLVQAPLGGLTEEEQGFAISEDELKMTSGDEPTVVVETDEIVEDFIEEPVVDAPQEFFDNLVPSLPKETLDRIKSKIQSDVETDKSSRGEWSEAYTKGLKLLGLRYETKTQPFIGATGVTHPLLNEAVTQFQSGAYKELLPSSGPVKAQIVGQATPDTEKQARRVQEYMNYQIMYGMEEYEAEFDQMLYFLGLAGSTFKKVYYDDLLQKPVSKFLEAENVLVPYSATDFRTGRGVTLLF